jgi:hypothetical protein
MDNDIAKQSQKFLTKQGLKFKLNTKVTAGEVHDAGVKINVEAAKGGKEETVSFIFGQRCEPLANITSLTLMSSLSLSAAALTPPVWVSTTSVSRSTRGAA